MESNKIKNIRNIRNKLKEKNYEKLKQYSGLVMIENNLKKTYYTDHQYYAIADFLYNFDNLKTLKIKELESSINFIQKPFLEEIKQKIINKSFNSVNYNKFNTEIFKLVQKFISTGVTRKNNNNDALKEIRYKKLLIILKFIDKFIESSESIQSSAASNNASNSRQQPSVASNSTSNSKQLKEFILDLKQDNIGHIIKKMIDSNIFSKLFSNKSSYSLYIIFFFKVFFLFFNKYLC